MKKIKFGTGIRCVGHDILVLVTVMVTQSKKCLSQSSLSEKYDQSWLAKLHQL